VLKADHRADAYVMWGISSMTARRFSLVVGDQFDIALRNANTPPFAASEHFSHT
jgi:hypothetical protein